MFVILSPTIGEHPTSRGTTFTIREKENNYFVKTFSDKNPEGDPPKMVTLFDIEEEYTPIDLEETLRMVKRFRDKQYMFAIRYAPNIDLPSKVGIRRNSEAFSLPKPSPILFMDIDSVNLPEHIKWWEVEKQADFVMSILNEKFPKIFPEDIGYIAKASGSSGIKRDKIRLHLYLENSHYLTTNQMAWFVNHEVNEILEDFIDPAPYHPRQPHYIADPAFLDSIIDPYKAQGVDRLVYKPGAACKIPRDTPEYVPRASITLGEEHSRFFDKTIGTKELTQAVMEKLERMSMATDRMFTGHVPSLYHLAWEEGIDLDYLEKTPTETEEDQYGPFLSSILSQYPGVISGRRTVQDYMRNGRKACLTKIVAESMRVIPSSIRVAHEACDAVGHSSDVPDNLRGGQWTEDKKIKLLSTNSKQADNFLKIDELPPEGSIAFLKASLGTGKTTAVKMWLATAKVKGRFLAITNTRALVDSNAQKFGAPDNEAYRKMKFHNEYYNDPRGRMSTTIHSIHRYKEMAEMGMIDFIFIDEADAVMNELLNSTLMRERTKCMDTLATLLETAKFVVLSDGDIGEETIEAYTSLCKKPKPVVAYDHKRDMLADCTAIELGDEESIWSIVNASLNCGEKTIVVTDLGPDQLNVRQKTLSNLHPNMVIKQIHANSSKDPDIIEILKHTNTALKSQEIDGLLCSPSVTNGVDFRYFDNVCVITKATTQAPNLRFQALRRDRGAKFIYYYTDSKTKTFRSGYTTEMAQETHDWLTRHQAKFGIRRTKESLRYPSTLRYYLLDQGCTVEIMREKWEPLDYSIAEEEYRSERINAIVMATEAYQPPRHNDAWEAKNEVVKYYGLDSVECVSELTAEAYVKEKPNKKMAFLHDIVRGGLWSVVQECVFSPVPFIKFLEKKGNLFYQATGNSANPFLGKMYLKQMGVEYNEDTKLADFDKVIRWYRAFCLMNDYKIPRSFMTPEEIALDNESNMDMGLHRMSDDISQKTPEVTKEAKSIGGLSWGAVTG